VEEGDDTTLLPTLCLVNPLLTYMNLPNVLVTSENYPTDIRVNRMARQLERDT
jgi:hypothetical protein